jgi:hypothetical protein
MYTIALATLTFHILGTVTMILGAALTSCMPDRPTRT